MLTFMQLKVMKANRVPLTQAQKAQIPDIEVAERFVRQAIDNYSVMAVAFQAALLRES